MKGIGQIIQMLAVAIVVGAAVYWFTKDGGGGSTTIVTVDQIKKIAQLATIDYHLSVTHYHEKPPVGLEWLPAKLFATVRGDIKGSVDMKKADINITNEKEKKIVKIVFPKGSVIISNPEIGAKDISFLTCSNPNPFHPLKDKDYTAAQREAIKAMVKTAKDDGIAVKTARPVPIACGLAAGPSRLRGGRVISLPPSSDRPPAALSRQPSPCRESPPALRSLFVT